MTSREYERRRRAIEEQCQADLELIQAGCQAKLRALEMVWLHSAGDEEAPRQTAMETVVETIPETVLGEIAPSKTVLSQSQDSGPARGWGYVLDDVKAVFPNLPELFDKTDLWQAIGYKPSRSTLHRVLDVLKTEGKLAVDFQSQGGRTTLYRKVPKT